MRPHGHLISSLVGAGLVYNFFGSFVSAIIFFVPGFLIDLDHIFDYVREYGLRKFDMKHFFYCCDKDKFKKIVLILHSFELVLILWIFIIVYKLNILWVALALSITSHLVLDQFTNNTVALSYFFTYRWIKHFNAKEIFRDENGE